MNDYIAESIKRLKDKYESFELCDRVCKGDLDRIEAFLKQELTAIVEKTREEVCQKIDEVLEKNMGMHVESGDSVIKSYPDMVFIRKDILMKELNKVLEKSKK